MLSIDGNFSGDQLKRILVTSSCASVVNTPYAGIYDESSWNEGAITEVMGKGKGASQLGKYRASKVLAEKGTSRTLLILVRIPITSNEYVQPHGTLFPETTRQ